LHDKKLQVGMYGVMKYEIFNLIYCCSNNFISETN
jgi:hypothetical protein